MRQRTQQIKGFLWLLWGIFLLPSFILLESGEEKGYSDPLKLASFEILQNKCNVCHQKQNRRRIFSLENMELWADLIYKQVFIKKRMPRGRKIKLSQAEYDTLHQWLQTQNLNKK